MTLYLITGRRALNSISLASLVVAMNLVTGSPVNAASPFNTLNGAWSGSGRVMLEGGQTERLRCQASYRSSSGGNHLGLSIRCASAANAIELRGDLNYSGGHVSGSWEERSHGASGDASGRATDNSVVLRFGGTASGTMSVALSGSSHTVSIASQGTPLRTIHVSLSRR
jgi:hypothetical protein